MTSPLERLEGLTLQPAAAEEFERLKRAAATRLCDARNTQIALASRFDLAYDAAHAYCLAALRYRGFRSKTSVIVFQRLPHTLGLAAEVWRVLAKCHELRNRGEYEGDLDVDERILTDLLSACDAVAPKVVALAPLRDDRK